MDPTVLAGAAGMVITAVTFAVIAIMKQQTAGKLEILAATKAEADKAAAALEQVMHKVDGNYSDLKAEVTAAKGEVVVANQRIAVLVERLITSTPATATPLVVVNGQPEK